MPVLKEPRNIAVLLSYDGTEYAGWQFQRDRRSIQGTLQNALADLHGYPVDVAAAGRTDAGVHAIGQVANFISDKVSVKDWQFRDALNARLPRDIRILKSRMVDSDFHARRSAQARVYAYHLIEGHAGPAHLARFAWLIPHFPALKVLNDMALAICGVHDFTTFTAAGDRSPHRIREVRHAVFLTEGSGIVFRITANAFLWRMVRSLVGTMIDMALKGGDGNEMRTILRSRNRSSAGPTAPARGLFLTKVDYGSNCYFF